MNERDRRRKRARAEGLPLHYCHFAIVSSAGSSPGLHQNDAPMPIPTVFRTALTGLEKIHEGKVRDIYAVDADAMLIVTTDRLSAFDVVLPDPIPNKGRVLHQISNFWFGRTGHIVPNHLTTRRLDSVVKSPAELAQLEGRAGIVRKLKAL